MFNTLLFFIIKWYYTTLKFSEKMKMSLIIAQERHIVKFELSK